MAKPRTRRRAFWWIAGLALAALVVYALLPSPLRVEVGRSQRGPMRVTVDEEGETRAHDRFSVAAPIPGRLMRVEFEEGDLVGQNQVVALIDPLPLSQREREEVLARVEAAEAAKRQADARVGHARADYELARRDRHRAEGLARDGVISTQALEQAHNAELTGAEELEAARYSARVAESEVKVARAGLVSLQPGNGGRIVQIRSPVSGRVLRIQEKSERVVQPGAPILTLGDPAKIEVVVDVLSTDAVKIKPGADVFLEGWGGDRPLRARVRLVEPSGFTKVSALGVEEQRVNVIADFVDPPGPLGDGYRVEVRIVVWSAENVLKVPASAVFRRGQGWSVFLIEKGRARPRDVEIGHRSETEVEILRGLNEGAQLILHPSNQTRDGLRVRPQ